MSKNNGFIPCVWEPRDPGIPRRTQIQHNESNACSLPEICHRTDRPETWQGIDSAERKVLKRILQSFTSVKPLIYTGVPLLTPEHCRLAPSAEDAKRVYNQCWPRRVDAILVLPTLTLLCEIKDTIDADAIGQIALYYYHATACYPLLNDAYPTLCGRTAFADVIPLARDLGITTITLEPPID